jgi:hypothetical protein
VVLHRDPQARHALGEQELLDLGSGLGVRTQSAVSPAASIAPRALGPRAMSRAAPEDVEEGSASPRHPPPRSSRETDAGRGDHDVRRAAEDLARAFDEALVVEVGHDLERGGVLDGRAPALERRRRAP